ncbi:MAG: [protein-PII] uridylyltransferase [Candidatus Binatia bacterium]
MADSDNDKHRDATGKTVLPSPREVGGRLSAVARDYVSAVRRELADAHWAGAGGLDTALRYSAATDHLIRFIFEAATERFVRRYGRTSRRCAVIAQGGYGRAEMNPCSDVDLLVFYDQRVDAYVETVTESLLYTLWDAGLQVGHAVRTTSECVQLADSDITIRTSLLDGRFLCGSTDLGVEYAEKVQKVLTVRDVSSFVEAKRRESQGRHERFGGSVFMLEPDVKEGKGGFRDIHTVLWMARLKWGVTTLEELAQTDLVSEHEVEELVAGREFLMRVRNSLHFLAEAKHDTLTFERQETIAQRFGYQADDSNSAAELFMRDYYYNAAIISRTTNDIIQRLDVGDEAAGFIERLGRRSLGKGTWLSDGRLLVDGQVLVSDPVNLLRVFHLCQRNGVALSPVSRELVRRNVDLLTEEISGRRDAVDAFMSVLKWKDGVYRTLTEMHSLGVLGRFLPEFGRLFCMIQYDYYHVYTVDEHSLVGVRELERLRQGVYQESSPLLTQIMRECDHPEVLFLAMMFHDVGKGYGGNHDERGAVMVGEVATRLHLHQDEKEEVEFLVRNHILMSELAQNRDIDDPELVMDFVEKVGTARTLRDLYLLTFSDMKAVGPKVWTNWKDSLLAELYLRAADVFDTGVVRESDIDNRVERVRARVIARASADAEKSRLTGFLETMPNSYFLANAEDLIFDHWRMYESRGDALFRSGVVHVPERGLSEFTVCVPDRPGLFLCIVGVLLAQGLDIVGARIATSSEGLAIDTFLLDHDNDDEDAAEVLADDNELPRLYPHTMDPEVWKDVRVSLAGVLEGSTDLESLVAPVRRNLVAAPKSTQARRRAVTKVEIDNKVSRQYTVIDVYAVDQPGLLFRVAQSIHDFGLTIHVAKITTHVDQVLDVFYVKDREDRKINDTGLLERIRAGILESVLAEEDGAGLRRSTGG